MCVVVPQDFFPRSDCCFWSFRSVGPVPAWLYCARVSLLTFWRYKMTGWLCSSNKVSFHVTLSDTLSDRQRIKSVIDLAGCNFESYRWVVLAPVHALVHWADISSRFFMLCRVVICECFARTWTCVSLFSSRNFAGRCYLLGLASTIICGRCQ